MDAYPGTPEELRLLGYRAQAGGAVGGGATGATSGTSGAGSSSSAQALANGTGSGAAGVGGAGGGGGGGGAGGAGGAGSGALDLDDGAPRPDFSQMVPFKPKMRWIPGEHRMPGGGFPLPPAAEALCLSLPPPVSFNGPFVMLDRLMEEFVRMKLPEEAARQQGWLGINFFFFFLLQWRLYS